MPTIHYIPQGGLPSPDTEVTDMDTSMQDMSNAPSSNMQDSDAAQKVLAESHHAYPFVDESKQYAMEDSPYASSSEESDEDLENASQTTHELPATKNEVSAIKSKKRVSISSLQETAEATECVSQSEESDEDAEILPPPTHDVAMTDISEAESEESDGDESATNVKPIRKIVVQMMKETKFQPNAKQHTFYNDNGTLTSPINLEYTVHGTDLRGWFDPKALYYAAIPSRLARGDFVTKLIKKHKAWICDDWQNGSFHVLDYACGTGLASQALASHVDKILGIDEDEAMVKLYNEIATRQKYPLCTMKAVYGNLIPYNKTGIPPESDESPNDNDTGNQNNDDNDSGNKDADQRYAEEVEKVRKELEGLEDFDLVVIAFALDSFEPPNLTKTHQRYRQLLDDLRPIVDRLCDWGTLLIIDVQKTSNLTPKPTLSGVTQDGYKIAGYHSNMIVNALKAMQMADVAVMDDNHFEWTATEQEKENWNHEKVTEVIFLLRARKRGPPLSHERIAELQQGVGLKG